MKAVTGWLNGVDFINSPTTRRLRRSRSKYQPHQGPRECARRRGEIGWQARRWLS